MYTVFFWIILTRASLIWGRSPRRIIILGLLREIWTIIISLIKKTGLIPQTVKMLVTPQLFHHVEGMLQPSVRLMSLFCGLESGTHDSKAIEGEKQQPVELSVEEKKLL